jgi:hypothetical protein
MQVAGKTLVLATFGIGLAMAVGAWWYNYQQSRRTAEFWGRDGATLIVGAPHVELLEVGKAMPAETSADAAASVAGREVVRRVDLSQQKGLVHLRHALTFDANFVWKDKRSEPANQGDWRYALRFARDQREQIALFAEDFKRLGRWDSRFENIESLPCPRLGPVVLAYLEQIGVALDRAPATTP